MQDNSYLDVLGNPKPARGDIVSYRGRHFYFQPMGSACALYQKRSDIGKMDKATHKPSPRSVFLVKREEHIEAKDEEIVESGNPVPAEADKVWDILDVILERMARLEIRTMSEHK
eukprot:TRINITY_DN4026_c0_g1_i1.p1 TRINITY_DN4026_c0_g1~~TRINITY_DN4026_c0_g1_i1.p1  ORF type:complete len:115 (+),score=22.59 TRINITY_DN4026_c0_g1_i1:239-583(+)